MSDLEGQGIRDHVSLDLGSLKLLNNRQPKGSLEELEAQLSAGGLPQLLEGMGTTWGKMHLQFVSHCSSRRWSAQRCPKF